MLGLKVRFKNVPRAVAVAQLVEWLSLLSSNPVHLSMDKSYERSLVLNYNAIVALTGK